MPAISHSKHDRMPAISHSKHDRTPGISHSKHDRMPAVSHSKHDRMPGISHSKHDRMPGICRHICGLFVGLEGTVGGRCLLAPSLLRHPDGHHGVMETNKHQPAVSG